jgi:molecular chaperone GrpE (heat shock protein)
MAQIIEARDILEKDIRTFNEFLSKDDTTKALSFARKALEGGSDNLKDILEFYDVMPYTIADNNKFNGLKQTAVKYVKTDDESLLKIVVESVSSGYERKGKVVRKERVTAYSIEKNDQKEI